jgi:hypothetical protein
MRTPEVTVSRPLSPAMPDDDIVLLSARNSFLVLLLLLLGISTYQFYTIRGVTRPVAAMWITAAGVFYLSKWYYGRQTDASTATTEKD